MQVGDGVLVHASNAAPSGVTGLAEVARAGYPDALAWKKGHTYFDPASTPDKPAWDSVDIRFAERFNGIVPRDDEGDAWTREHDGHEEGQPAAGFLP